MEYGQLKKYLERTDLKLFVFFILVFTLFISWGGDNSWSRYDLTESIAENKSFNIANNSHNTRDKVAPSKVFLDGYKGENWREANLTSLSPEEILGNGRATRVFESSNVVYSDKAPFSSILALPGYMIGDIVNSAFNHPQNDVWFREGVSSTLIDSSTGTSLKMSLVVFTVPVLLGSSLLLLVYHYCREYVDKKSAFYTVMIAGMASPLIIYSSSFFGVISAAFFGFSSYLAVIKSSTEKRFIYLAGILSALAVSTEYYAGIIPLFLLFYLVLEKEYQDTYRFIISFFGAMVPALVYHWVTTGNPLMPPVLSHKFGSIGGPIGATCEMFVYCYSTYLGFVLDPARIFNASLRLLFFPMRGIFFYSPILLLAIPGAVSLYKRDKKLLFLFSGIFFTLLIFQASRLNWLAGVSFGPRYVVVGIPFLLPMMALGIEKVLSKGNIWKAGFILLFLLSSFNMLLGFGSWGDLDIDSQTYAENFNSFGSVQESFYEERIENFGDYGPRSELMMSVTDRYKGLDITYSSPYGPDKFEIFSTGDEGLLFSARFLPIILVSALSTVFFWRESSTVGRLSALILLITILTSFSVSETYNVGEVYRSDGVLEAVNGSMTFVTHLDEQEVAYLDIDNIISSGKGEIEVRVNGELDGVYNITRRSEIYLLSTTEGRNKINIDAPSCETPALQQDTDWDETRCLSFAVKQIGVNDTEDFGSPKLRGFFGDEINQQPWLSTKAEIFFGADEKDSIPIINFSKIPYLNDSELKIKVNREYVRSVEANDLDKNLYLYNASVKPGINRIDLESDGCEVPAEKDEDSPDTRCLSYRLENFSMASGSELPEFIFREGWHEEGSEGRWMADKSGMMVKLEEENSLISLDLTPYRGLESDQAEIIVNGKSVRNISLDRRKQVMIPVKGRKGWNNLEIRYHGGCKVPAQMEGSDDDRCLSLFLDNVEVSTADHETIFQKGWYSPENTEFESYRWMTNTSYIVYNSSGKEILTLSADKYDQMYNSSLMVFADGDKLAEVQPDDFEKKQVYIKKDPGISTLRFESSEGCRVPAELEQNSQDTRCLSYRFKTLELSEESFGKGWYSKEESSDFSYRWMEEEAEMKFPAEEGQTRIELEFKPYEHLADPILDIYKEGQRIDTIDLRGLGRVDRVVELQTDRGVNNIVFRSRNGCETPANHEELSNDIRCLSFQFSSVDVE